MTNNVALFLMIYKQKIILELHRKMILLKYLKV